MPQDNPTKFAYSIAELAEDGPVGKSTLNSEIAAGRLVARKIGRRTIIIADDWRSYLAGLPRITPTAPAASLPALPNARRPRGRPRKVPLADARDPLPADPTGPAGLRAPALPKSEPSKIEPDRALKKFAKIPKPGIAQ
jgi:hypothetical protein